MSANERKIWPKLILRDFVCVNCGMGVAEDYTIEFNAEVMMEGLDLHLGKLRRRNRIACRKCKDIEEAINAIGAEAAKEKQ